VSITKKERIRFGETFREHCPKLWDIPREQREREIALLLRRSTAYKAIQEKWCNEPLSEKKEAYYLKREKNIEQRITEFLATIDAKPTFGGDPRGATVKIICPDGFTDDWGHEGLCVPTS
jgi:hypothetical protein